MIIPDYTQERRRIRAERLKEQSEKRNEEFDRIEDNSFSFYRDILLFSGTIFGSSIALSIGKTPNLLFVISEFLLALSIACGFITLWAKINGDYNFYFIESIFEMEGDLTMNKDLMEEFEQKATKDSIEDMRKITARKGFLYKVLKKIKIDQIRSASVVCAISGVFLLWMSTFVK